jgi:hypothetical protein
MEAPTPQRQDALRQFFDAYSETFNQALRDPREERPSEIMRSFADAFVVASPEGVHSGKKGLLFRFVIPRVWARYRKIGIRRMTAVDVDVTPTDSSHVLARVHWLAEYVRPKDGVYGEVEFDNHYWLDVSREPRIFACVTPDENRILAEHGLIEMQARRDDTS